MSVNIQDQLDFIGGLQEDINERLLHDKPTRGERASLGRNYRMLDAVFCTLNAVKGLREATGGKGG